VGWGESERIATMANHKNKKSSSGQKKNGQTTFATSKIKNKNAAETAGNPQTKNVNVPRNVFVKDVNTPYTYEVNAFGRRKQVVVRQSSADETWPGGALWDIGVLLSHVFCSSTFTPIHNNRWTRTKVLELGAGVGLTGIVVGVLGAQQVLVTDLPVVVDNITQPNVELNSEHYKCIGSKKELRVKARALSWGNERDEKGALAALNGSYPDLIIAGDVSYQQKPGAPSHFEALVQSVLHVSNEDTIFVFGHRVRMEASNDLLEDFRKHFEYLRDPIPAEQIDSSFAQVGKHNISIHIMKRRSQGT
jgi:predicted nicotinamide N-methyase